MKDAFPPEAAKKLNFYVYPLIDPRNGETFYVGKGRNNRVFEHARGALRFNSGQEDALDAKIQRIKEIVKAGLEVGDVIHRHGIDDEKTALQIEAAVMDAYPGLTNKVRGCHSGDFGVAHAQELLNLYAAEQFKVEAHRHLLLVSIPVAFGEEGKTIYEAARYAWVLKPDRARRAELVLAHVRGLVVGVFKPKRWMEAEKFAQFKPTDSGRWGFVGEEAEDADRRLYLGKRVPDRYRAKGAANSVRFIDPSSEASPAFGRQK